jgi:hypothetical protein
LCDPSGAAYPFASLWLVKQHPRTEEALRMDRVMLREKGHSAYLREGALVIEWYDFGDDAPYESANMIVFDAAARAALARSLGLAGDAEDSTLLTCIERSFPSWFEAKSFAQREAIAFKSEVDFMP